MESPKVQSDLFSNRPTRDRMYLGVIMGLVIVLAISFLVLPSIGDPTAQEKNFIEYGHLRQEINANGMTWNEKEVEQSALTEANNVLRLKQAELETALFQ